MFLKVLCIFGLLSSINGDIAPQPYVNATLGSVINLTCVATGNNAVISWTINGEGVNHVTNKGRGIDISNSGNQSVLTIEATERNSDLVIQCIIGDSLYTTHFNVFGVGPPQIINVTYLDSLQTNISWSTPFHTVPIYYGVTIFNVISDDIIDTVNTTETFQLTQFDYCVENNITVTVFSMEYQPAINYVLIKYMGPYNCSLVPLLAEPEITIITNDIANVTYRIEVCCLPSICPNNFLIIMKLNTSDQNIRTYYFKVNDDVNSITVNVNVGHSYSGILYLSDTDNTSITNIIDINFTVVYPMTSLTITSISQSIGSPLNISTILYSNISVIISYDIISHETSKIKTLSTFSNDPSSSSIPSPSPRSNINSVIIGVIISLTVLILLIVVLIILFVYYIYKRRHS